VINAARYTPPLLLKNLIFKISNLVLMENKGVLREKSFQLAVRTVRLCHYLREKKREFEITKQLFKSGTNPGAMVRESEYAQSGLDFINKLEVAQKELNEYMLQKDAKETERIVKKQNTKTNELLQGSNSHSKL
jgi:four helix bundle protein